MKLTLAAAAAAALVAMCLPVMSQGTGEKIGTHTQSGQQTAPGEGGVSKPGTAGLPGSKSGPTQTTTVGEGAAAKTPGGLAEPSEQGSASSTVRQQDQTGVAGLPGSKSGPAQSK